MPSCNYTASALTPGNASLQQWRNLLSQDTNNPRPLPADLGFSMSFLGVSSVRAVRWGEGIWRGWVLPPLTKPSPSKWFSSSRHNELLPREICQTSTLILRVSRSRLTNPPSSGRGSCLLPDPWISPDSFVFSPWAMPEMYLIPLVPS